MPEDSSQPKPHLRALPSGTDEVDATSGDALQKKDAPDRPPAELRAERLARAREEARAILRARAAAKEAAAKAKVKTTAKPKPAAKAPAGAKAAAQMSRAAARGPGQGAGPKGPGKATGKATGPAAAAAKASPKPAPGAAQAKPGPKQAPKQVPDPTAPSKAPLTPAAKPAPAPAPETDPAAAAVLPPASASKPRGRHWGVVAGFLLMVVVPIAVAAWYLWNRAADQYVSDLGFTVRREEAASPNDLLGGLTNFSSAGSSDTDILYEYIQSQQLVRLVDEALDLRTRYAVHSDIDPVFAFNPEGSIEDLVSYWRRMVQISYNPGSGMIELRAFAFDPDTAQAIAGEILKNSSALINDLSAIAREDATRYAREDLEAAQNDLKAAREALTAFRSRTRIIDPAADLQSQMGILNTLQAQLAEAIIELDLLRETTSDNDARVTRALRRIEVIEDRIDEERSKFGQGGAISAGEEDYATLVAEFERLTVDREFAEQTYIAALSGFASAQAEADRQSRYLAAYVRPTLAETATHPQRVMLLGVVSLFLLLAWAIVVLIYYSLRDRQ